MLVDKKVRDFIEELASDSPAPGGGSIAALSGASGAALLSMFAGLTIGKEKYKESESEMRRLLSLAQQKAADLLQAVDNDTAAFNQLMAAFRLPKSTAEEKANRKEAIAAALDKTIEIPLGVATHCVELLGEIVSLISKGNENAVTDAGVGALVLHAGMRGAIYNVRINLLSIKNEQKREDFKNRIKKLTKEGEGHFATISRYLESALET